MIFQAAEASARLGARPVLESRRMNLLAAFVGLDKLILFDYSNLKSSCHESHPIINKTGEGCPV